MKWAFQFLCVWVLLQSPVALATSSSQSPSFFMPDGQLKSHTVRVYLDQDISAAQQPRLMLLRSHAITKKAVDETARIEPKIVAPGQHWMEKIDGQQVQRTGTLLLFDLSSLPFHFKAMMRVLPILRWSEGGSERLVAAAEEVNLGNIVAVVGWTLLFLVITVGLILWLARKSGESPLKLLSGVDGHLSLSLTQVSCWTVVIGGVVLGYGMVKLEVPEIPASLLVLMGASLVTGGVGHFQDAKKLRVLSATGPVSSSLSPKLADLLSTFDPGQPPRLSLAKAQMLFWTLLLIALFVSKSILDGVIWEVPWPLVTLMGFSQAGYLAPKVSTS